MAQYVDGGLGECGMVATHQFDVAGAMNAGMDGIFVNRFGVPTSRLGFEPDVSVGSYAELADRI
jgi:2-haloacid dehalogenase